MKKNPSLQRVSERNLAPRSVCFVLDAVAIFAIASACLGPAAVAQSQSVPTNIVGVQHLGTDFSISEFYLNRHYGSGVGRNGGGAGFLCCATLPSKWRPGMKAEVRWEVRDWSHEIPAETKKLNFQSLVTEGFYIADVPIEKYDEVGDIYVHFFAGGKVRIVTSNFGVRSPSHPILLEDPNAAEAATTGKRLSQMFTAKELADMK